MTDPCAEWRSLPRLHRPLALRPDPQYRANRLAQFDTARRNRYLRNVASITDPLWANYIDNRRRERVVAIKAMT